MRKLILIVATIVFMACTDSTPVDIKSLKHENNKFYNENGSLFNGNVFHNFNTTDTIWLEGSIDNGVPITYSVPENLASMNSRNNLYYPINSNEPYSGPFFSVHLNGKVKQQGVIKDGQILSQPFITFYDNGQTKKIDFQGSVLEYYQNGQITSKTTIEDENIQIIAYYEDGSLEISYGGYITGEIASKEFITDNPYAKYLRDTNQVYVFNGEMQIFYPSGKQQQYSNYNKGSLDGEKITYYENEQIERKESYKNGLLNGEKLTYYDNGELKSKSFFIDNELDGESLTYFDNGKIKSFREYSKGMSIGTHYGFKDDQSTVKFKFFYDEEGRQQGESYFFQDSKAINSYIDDKKNGKSFFSNEDSSYAFVVKGYDKNDVKEGIEVTYKRDSFTYYDYRLSGIVSYKNGKKNGLAISIFYYANKISLLGIKNYLDDIEHGIQYSMDFSMLEGVNEIPPVLIGAMKVQTYEVKQYNNGKREGVQIKTTEPAYAKVQGEPIIQWSEYSNGKYEDGGVASNINDANEIEKKLWSDDLLEQLFNLEDLYAQLLEDVDSNKYLNNRTYDIDLSVPNL